MTVDHPCPACNEDVEHEQFCDDFACPHCGVVLQSMHECVYGDEDSWCWDSLEVA